MQHYILRSLLLVLTCLPLFCGATTEAANANVEQAVDSPVTTEQRININSVDAATLQRALSGVGAVKAQAIVDYRQEHGAFVSVDELLEVKGIGTAILEKNHSKLYVE